MRTGSEMKADSLSDIMFFLMLFFLIMSTMIAPQVIKIKLPKADAGKTLSKQNLMLSVNADKKYFIDKEEVPLADLESALSKRIATGKELTVILRADKETPWQDIVNLVAISNKLKLNVSLAVEKASS